MKTMTCKQLGGACELEFHADSFEDIAVLSQKHGMEMISKGDRAHIEAMNKMREIMQSPDSMTKWMEMRKKEFDNLPKS